MKYSKQVNEKEMIEVVVQPIVEVNQPVDFKIYFREEPDLENSKTEVVDGIEFSSDLEDGFSHLSLESGRFLYKTDVIFSKTGEIMLPEISVTVGGVEYKSIPYPIQVVKKIDINESFLKTVLVSDKESYSIDEPVKISLLQYSRISNISCTPAVTDEELPEGITQESLLDGLFGIKSLEELNELTFNYCVTGIKDFSVFFIKDFKPVELEINIFNEGQHMEELDGILYIKTEIFSIVLTPKQVGEFVIPSSIFEYTLYKNNGEYFAHIEPNEDGSHELTDCPNHFRISSNPLKLVIR